LGDPPWRSGLPHTYRFLILRLFAAISQLNGKGIDFDDLYADKKNLLILMSLK
jgi:hypothetical protein